MSSGVHCVEDPLMNDRHHPIKNNGDGRALVHLSVSDDGANMIFNRVHTMAWPYHDGYSMAPFIKWPPGLHHAYPIMPCPIMAGAGWAAVLRAQRCGNAAPLPLHCASGWRSLCSSSGVILRKQRGCSRQNRKARKGAKVRLGSERHEHLRDVIVDLLLWVDAPRAVTRPPVRERTTVGERKRVRAARRRDTSRRTRLQPRAPRYGRGGRTSRRAQGT